MRDGLSVVEAVRHLRVRSGLSVRALADRAGFGSPNAYRHYETLYKRDNLPLEVARQLADALAGRGEPPIDKNEVLALAFDEAYPLTPASANASRAPDSPNLPLRGSMPRDVPVFGTAQAGPDGSFWLNMQQGAIDYVRRPPGLMSNQRAFAVYVEGDSMVPWKEPGALLFANPNRPPSPGCYVVLEFLSGDPGRPAAAMVKRLVRRSASAIELEQYNPPKTFKIDAEKVVAIYRVMEVEEILGV